MEENHNKNKGVAANCSSDDDVEKYVNSLPVGFRFAPHDDELILHYLLKKIKKLPLPRNRIHEGSKVKEGKRTGMHEYLVNPKLVSSTTTSRPKNPLQPMLKTRMVLGLIPPPLTLNNFVYDPPTMNNTLNYNFNYDPPPVNNTFSDSFVYNVPPIQSYLPSSYSYDFQPIYGCPDQVCYSDCMEMPTINNNQSMPTEESIPSFPTIQSIYGYGDQVCYSDRMEMPTINNNQSMPTEESIPSFPTIHPSMDMEIKFVIVTAWRCLP
ncbi:hypothetical protein GH714_008378 [Hevea brasiliensis]|uniref:NAC domain-containing protein n=1 Tax=Hevea brasiliensis TaxID=3981 RepID=A0A6A6L1H3_HEVBR|nr:hypothetical protein GH714_008378 [Hevea brasiliensis]